MQSTRLDRSPARTCDRGACRVRRLPWSRALVGLAAAIALGAPLGCDGAAGSDGADATLPLTLDLRSDVEASRWRAGPAIAALRASDAGLVIEGLPGSTAGRFVERALRVGPDRLGAIELEIAATTRPMRPMRPMRPTEIEIVPIVEGRVRTRQAVVARAHPDHPQRLVARFRTGAWNRAALDGVRLVLDADTDRIALTRLRVTTERYAPLPPAPSPTPTERVPDGAQARPHVILLVADTLRADRMSLYGAARSTTPNLDRLAANGTVFDRAWSQSACTFPSVNALLTGQSAASFLGEPAAAKRTLLGRGALAERLGRAGHATAAVSASWVVRATPSVHNDWGGGYDAGFAHFDESCAGEAAACVNRRALEWIDRRVSASRPFFLYLHYLDPHDPYRPPPDHARRFAADGFPDARVRAGDPNALVEAAAERATDQAKRHLLDLYDDEIAYLDEQIGRLFDALDDRELLAHTIVVLASDHGEAFDEHGDWKHCSSVYEEQIRTPLAFWGPGVPRGLRSDTPAENVDILPTILALVGLETAASDETGSSGEAEKVIGERLLPTTPRSAPASALAHSSQGPWQSVTDGRHKWIEHVRRGTGALYDLAADPRERAPLPLDSAATEAIRAALATAMSVRGEDAAARDRAWSEVERELRALGYLD